MNRKTLELILNEEGGYVNHKNDSGGETIFGLTRKNYPNLKIWLAVDGMKANGKLSGKLTSEMKQLRNQFIDEIELVYNNYFVGTSHLVKKWSDNSNAEAFIVGFAVNSGIKRCVTIANNSVTFNDFKNNVISYYRKIAVGKNECFKKGWENRLKRLANDPNIKL